MSIKCLLPRRGSAVCPFSSFITSGHFKWDWFQLNLHFFPLLYYQKKYVLETTVKNSLKPEFQRISYQISIYHHLPIRSLGKLHFVDESVPNYPVLTNKSILPRGLVVTPLAVSYGISRQRCGRNLLEMYYRKEHFHVFGNK